jgi:hypothetical protein
MAPSTLVLGKTTMQQDLVHNKKQPQISRTGLETIQVRLDPRWLFMLVIYYGFILIIAFNKEFLAQPLWDGIGHHRRYSGRCRRDLSALLLTGHLRLPRQFRVRPADSTKSRRKCYETLVSAFAFRL